MAEYIEREAFAADIRESYCELKKIFDTLRYERERDICNGELGTFCEILMRIKEFPAADVAPVVHGYWKIEPPIVLGGVTWHYCSVCGSTQGNKWMNYCPNCGARMDGE